MPSLINSRTNSRSARHTRTGGLLYRRGRSRVIWLHGVGYFGGSLFLFYNAIAYFLNPQPPRSWQDFLWIAFWSLLCFAAGYLRGLLTWHSLQKIFGPAKS